MQFLGSTGSTVDSTHYGFVLVAATVPASDDYQAYTIGERSVGFNNITIVGAGNGTSWNVDGTAATCSMTAAPYCNSGMLFQNPTLRESTDVNAALENLQVVHFPGNALAAFGFNGEFRGYNVYAGASGGNCVDIENKGNPYRFYGLTVTGCPIGINLVSTGGAEYFGANVFGNDIDVSVSGTTNKQQAFIVFDGLHLDKSTYENMFLDQQNETVVCTSNCTFGGMNGGGSNGGDADSAIVVGYNAVAASSVTKPILRLNQGFIKPDTSAVGAPGYLDVRFDTNLLGDSCDCEVALGDGMLNISKGIIASNTPAKIAGPIFYGGPSVGTPLQLNANELGLAANPAGSTAAQPGAGGMKLRVQCNSDGSANLVALAGTSSTPAPVVSNVGTGVCNP